MSSNKKKLAIKGVSFLLSVVFFIQGHIFYFDGKNDKDLLPESLVEAIVDLFGNKEDPDLFIPLTETYPETTDAELEKADCDDPKFYEPSIINSIISTPDSLDPSIHILLILKSHKSKIPSPPPENLHSIV